MTLGEKLPLWRLLTAVFILGGMVTVLLALAPVYLRNYQLQQYLRQVAAIRPATVEPDEQITLGIITRAHDLDLPVQTGDIQLKHDDGKLGIELTYKVQKDFGLYQVDLHFRPAATSR